MSTLFAKVMFTNDRQTTHGRRKSQLAAEELKTKDIKSSRSIFSIYIQSNIWSLFRTVLVPNKEIEKSEYDKEMPQSQTIYEPRHEISNNVVHVCATSKGSDQPAHTRRLIRAYASR